MYCLCIYNICILYKKLHIQVKVHIKISRKEDLWKLTLNRQSTVSKILFRIIKTDVPQFQNVINSEVSVPLTTEKHNPMESEKKGGK